MPGAEPAHPKDILYRAVYEPLTAAWFDELTRSKQRHELLAAAPGHNLLHNLDELTGLTDTLVDLTFDALGDKLDPMVSVLRKHREHVLWEEQMTPSYRGSDRQFKTALNYKVKRNISMGAVEIVICLEAATTYGKYRLGLRGERLASVLRRSGQLGASLGLLHDRQEQQRLTELTGEPGYLRYPDVNFADVIEGGRYRIAQDKLVEAGSGEALRLKFICPAADPGPFDSPTRRCPAFRLSGHDAGMMLNDDLWSLIVDIYHLSRHLD